MLDCTCPTLLRGRAGTAIRAGPLHRPTHSLLQLKRFGAYKLGLAQKQAVLPVADTTSLLTRLERAPRPLSAPLRVSNTPFGPETPQQAEKPDWLRDFEQDAEHDPQIAALLKGANGDPEIIKQRMMAYVTNEKDIISEDSGSVEQMDVVLRGIDPFNCWIWLEMLDNPSEEDVETCSEVFKSWFVLGRLGGFNSMNMQVFGGAEDGADGISYMKYDKEELETTVDSTFHDMTSMEQRGKWLRTWVNLGTADEIAMDVLINALSTFSKEHAGIKQLVIGGENEDWAIPEAELPQSSMNPMSTDMPGAEFYDKDSGYDSYDDERY